MIEHQSQPGIQAGKIRVVYFGTPEYAIPALQLLADDDRFDVSLVVTQPDRPAGRRHLLTEPPVKIAAREAGLHVYQPESLRFPEARIPLVEANADVFVVAAYGLIFGSKTLTIPRAGCVNLHASLLPKYRGASPIPSAIWAGETETGVSLMRMAPGLDTGPVYAARSVPIERTATTDQLTGDLAMCGAELLRDCLVPIVSGEITPTMQIEAEATMTRLISKDDGAIDWSDSAEEIERQIRAMWPWPRAWTLLGDQPLQIQRATVGSAIGEAASGSVVLLDSGVQVACGVGSLILEVVQPAGSKSMTARSWIAGMRGSVPVLQSPDLVRSRPPLVSPVTV